MEGKVFVRLDQGEDSKNLELIVGCNLPGKWILHWGVSRVDDVGRYIMLNKVFEFMVIKSSFTQMNYFLNCDSNFIMYSKLYC